MKIIDAHIHTLEVGTMCSGSVNVDFGEVKKRLNKFGIERALLLPINDISWQPVKPMNEYLVEIVNENKNYEGFIDIDISKAHLANGIKEMEEEIKYYHEKGLKGIKVHLQNLGVYADDWRLLPIYRLAGELNIPVTIHCYPGSPPGLSDHSNPVHLEKVIRVFHKTDFIIAHLGGIKYFYEMPNLNHDNVYFETSGVLPILKKYIGIENISRILQEIGTENIIFGSDYPTKEIDEAVNIIKKIVSKEDLNKIMYKNVLKLASKYNWWGEG